MSKEKKLIPALRFPEFKEEGGWLKNELSTLGELINGLTYNPNDVRPKGLLVLRSSNIQNGLIDLKDCVYVRPDIKGANLSQPNDILVCVRNGSKALIGKNAIIPKDMPLATHGAFMTVFRAKIPEFVYQLFQTDAYNKQVKADLGATINSINGKNFLKYEFLIPENADEQKKIAACLTSLDEVIKAHSQKLELLKDHKKGLMQNLFPSEGKKVPKFRFPEFVNDGEWVEKKLGDIAKLITRKNKNNLVTRVLTNSAVNGIVDQRDFFDREIVTESNLEGYYVVEIGDFVYNPRVSTVAPVGPISVNKASIGVMSPLYTVFRFNSANMDFFEQYFKTNLWHSYLRDNSNSGARHDRMNISVKAFINLPLLCPNIEEQKKIASCLSNLDELIIEQASKIEQLKCHKAGLMQVLFPKMIN